MNILKNKVFLANLKTTLKFCGLVWFALSVLIMFETTSDGGGGTDIMFPMYFLGLLPSMVFGCAIYTRLKLSTLNKYFSAAFFSVLVTIVFSVTFWIAGYLETGRFVFDGFAIRSRGIGFITMFLLYLQLPWER